MRSKIISIALLASVVLALLIAWGMRFYNEDLFVALCAGRDVVQGRIAQPDTWAFTTSNTVWVDQGLLSHLLFFLSYTALEHWGPVLIKGALLACGMIILYVRCVRLDVSAPVSLLAVSLGTLAAAPFAQIRAENFGLLCFLALTGLLTASRSSAHLRYIGVFVVFALWCNSHGSFILGFLFIGIKAGICLLGAFTAHERRTEFLAWTGVLIACVGAAALFTPYGVDNLLMPYRQLSATAMTGRSEDWIPLLDLYFMARTAFFNPLDVKPFLILVGSALLMGCAALAVTGPRNLPTRIRHELRETDRPDRLMEFIIALAMIAMCFRFRRFISFAGPALVPALALLLKFWIERWTSPAAKSRLPVFLALLWAAACLWIFLRTTVVPYLPDNPMRPNRPLERQLMSFDNHGANLVRFMGEAGVSGRVFAGWTHADYILFHVPDVRVFFDVRDQSAYSDTIIEQFFTVLAAREERPASVRRALEILDRYSVSTVALKASPIEAPVAVALLRSKRWSCLYKDAYFYLLVRPSSEKLEALHGDVPRAGLPYPNRRTAVESAATMRYFQTGAVPRGLQTSMMTALRATPDPDLYRLLAWANMGPNGRLRTSVKEYFGHELTRLSRMSPLYPDGANEVLNSIVRIADLLLRDEQRCGVTENHGLYRKLMNLAERRITRLRREYLGY